jgi:hypothetical protein
VTSILPSRLTGEERAEVAQQMAALYTAGASLAALVALTGRSYCVVRNLVMEGGAVMRPARIGPHVQQSPHVPEAVLTWLYQYKGMTLEAIADFVGMSPSGVSRRLERAGVPRRLPGGFHVAPAEMAQMYTEDGRSIRDIAQVCGRSYRAVHKALVREGVQLRPPGRHAGSGE